MGNKNILLKVHSHLSLDWKNQVAKLPKKKITLKTNNSTNNRNERTISFPIMLKPINHDIRLAYHFHF